ncbi:dihydrodipicolinate synthase family protein [Roseisalinus antarcticus]|uniref:L-2-keto-3-deoxyarabonate dehydratase n=1 Tax=Roseisalinus antarcticus TaxID=254357 RepID=A0A1Y5TXU8_9RHOB|nr:dihydrodipicolinate synthase family protein [Roseisalinus antarcticus]SLN75386.1 L-2-keto-3-deoxyarabonate dehydratase [Roseisalinus antarcticus]
MHSTPRNFDIFPPGAVAMLMTPFRQDWSVDLNGMARTAELAIEQGASGLAVHGLASEGYKLLDRERREIVERIAQVNSTPLLLAGVDHEALICSVELAKAAAGAGATAIMAMPPKSSGGNRAHLVEYFGTLEAESSLPVVIQDAPRASGIAMAPDTLVALTAALSKPNAIKVEDPIPPLKMADLLQRLPDDGRTVLYGGAGGRRFLGELDAGAIGTMVGPAYIDVFGAVQDLHATDRTAATALFEHLLPLLTAVDGNEWYALLQKQLFLRAGLIEQAGLRPPAVVPEARYLDELVALFVRTAARHDRMGAALRPLLNLGDASR